MRDYTDRLVTPPKWGTSPTWGPPPSCKQALTLKFQTLIHPFWRGVYLFNLKLRKSQGISWVKFVTSRRVRLLVFQTLPDTISPVHVHPGLKCEKTGTKNVQLVLQHCCKTSSKATLLVLPPTNQTCLTTIRLLQVGKKVVKESRE